MTELLEWFTGPDELELGWKFDPFEKRDERGRWTRGGEAYTAPDPDRLILAKRRGSYYYRSPADHPFFQEHPVSAANVVAAYDDSDAQERAQGMRWYADAHNLAAKMDQGDIEKNAGVIAALSPQTGWAVNMFNADRSLDENRALGPGEGMITGSMQANAQEAIDGMDADEANNSSKTKAFARLIRAGGDEPDDHLGQVVIDRHAMTVAMDERLPKKEADKAPIDKDRYYQYVADTYRNAALEISARGTPVSPHQVQAITWLRQQRINEAEDEAAHELSSSVAASRGGRRLSKGRSTMLRNAWDKWQAEAARHGYTLVPGTTGLLTEQFSNVQETERLLSAQVLDMGTGWLHEERDTTGRWTHGGGGLESHAASLERHGYRGRFEGYDPQIPSMEAADQRKPLNLPGRPDGAGTPEDPIDAQGDMGRAVDLMAAGSHVRLSSPAEIKPLLDAVNAKASAQGYTRDNEPPWDLGLVSVKGTRLFNEQTLGIPRTDMPQLNGPARPGSEAALLAGGANKFIELDPEFRDQLRRDGIDVKNERVPAGNLRATQTQLTAATVAGITAAAEKNVPAVRKMLKEPIWVTSDNYVIDGHHRWASDEALAYAGLGPKEIEVQRIGLPARLAIPYAISFAVGMGIGGRALGNARLVEGANTDSEPLIDMAFNPDQLRDDRGRWAKFGAVGEAADIMRQNREGFSVSLHTGGEPKTGYMVAQTDHTHVFPESVLDDRKALTRAIDDMLMSEKSAFRDRSTFLGGWVHGGKLWLEPSDNITSKSEAVRAAAERNQIAIWDVNNGAEIQTGGTGGGSIIEHANAEGDRAYPAWLLGPPGGRAAGGSGEDSRAGPGGIDAPLLDLAFHPDELRDFRGRWTRGRTEQMHIGKLLRAAADPFVGAPIPNEQALDTAVVAETAKAANIVPRLLGGSHEEWDGEAELYRNETKPHILAEMEWNGTLSIADNVAAAIKDASDRPDDPVRYPDAFEVLEHEMIHGVVPEGSAARNKRAYQVFALSQIEEGFTELGAIHHAAEFMDQMGLGDRQAHTFPGHTVREMAETINNPDEITRGNAWGHYPQQTKDAQDWVQQVVQQENLILDSPQGKARIVELTNEINRMGADGKVPVMSRQLATAMVADEPKMRNDQKFLDEMIATIMEAILKQWNTDNPEGAAKQAFGAAKTLAFQKVAEKQREMAEAA
jgi:hypothetical protein